MSDIFSKQVLLKFIMTCRHRSMRSKQGGTSNYFLGFGKDRLFMLDIISHPFQANKSTVAFVAVVEIRFDPQKFQGT